MFVVAVRPALSRFVERIVRRLGNFVHPKLGDQPRQANASRPAETVQKPETLRIITAQQSVRGPPCPWVPLHGHGSSKHYKAAVLHVGSEEIRFCHQPKGSQPLGYSTRFSRNALDGYVSEGSLAASNFVSGLP
jgi:hypothetical protein